ncbi:hypothetical protein [Pseudonocardia spirodelae]|uniref:Tetratricopeptide repeat protein n=1 Tax=Pseudonocardia spirodelae TaxID=3133431 RepID=A0ABU8TEM0_9PSEU
MSPAPAPVAGTATSEAPSGPAEPVIGTTGTTGGGTSAAARDTEVTHTEPVAASATVDAPAGAGDATEPVATGDMPRFADGDTAAREDAAHTPSGSGERPVRRDDDRREDRGDDRRAPRGREDRGPRRDRDDRGPRSGRDDRGARSGRDDRGPRGGRDDRGERRDRDSRPRRIPESAERTFVAEPDLPDSVSASDLDASVRADLRGLQKETAEVVARHLVAAGVLVDEEPELALEHVRYARRRASRIAVVREASGIVAYHAGEWNEALGEFRAARRMGGGPGHVHVMADIERALGRPERALDLARSPEARNLGHEERIELLIVAAGARRDLGETGAAVVGLQVPELDPARRDPWSARLFYAYADNLLAAGREAEAVQWFVHAHDADPRHETDAAARIAELTGEELPGSEDDLAIGWEDAPVGDGPIRPSAPLDEDADTADADTTEEDAAEGGTTAEAATPAARETAAADSGPADEVDRTTAEPTGPAPTGTAPATPADGTGPGTASGTSDR